MGQSEATKALISQPLIHILFDPIGPIISSPTTIMCRDNKGESAMMRNLASHVDPGEIGYPASPEVAKYTSSLHNCPLVDRKSI